MTFRKRRRSAPEVSLTSLIDVVLQLLIFFMLSTSFVTQPGIPVNLPKASSKGKTATQENATIVITAENTMFLNNKEARNMQELRDALVTLRKKQTADLVVVKADERVAHGVVVTVMDIAKTSGFSKLAIATQ